MTQWLRERSLLVRVLVYVAAATLVFVLAVGVGGIVSLMLQGDVGSLEGGEPRPTNGQDVRRTQQRGDVTERARAPAEQKEGTSQRAVAATEQQEVAFKQEVATYVSTVGNIQAGAVETFLRSHEKLQQYDALNADDIQAMEANEAALLDLATRASELTPPREYNEQHEVFSAAIEELREAARLAHVMAADPVAATELGFDEYDGRVRDASALLQRSNDLLGKDYAAIEGVREISPEF
jgi:hypothetical protein